MLALLISILISLNVHFTVIDGKIELSSSDMKTLQSSELYQKSGIDASESITINDGVDPSSTSTK